MKMKELLLLIFILLITPNFLTAQEPDWLVKLKQQNWFGKVGQIKLLKTSRAEVEGIFGKTEDDSYVNYLLGKENILDLDYTEKVCSTIDGKVDKDSVEEIEIRLDSEIRFSKLVSKIKMPLNQFKYSKGEGCLPDIEHYVNEQYGIDIRVSFDRVNTITFSIPEEKNFNCVTIRNFLSDLDKIKQIKLLESTRDDVQKIFAGYKFEKYSDLNHKEQIETDSESITITYSEGICEYDESDGYNVPEWKVENITVSPINDIIPKDFGFDLSRYKREQVYKDNFNSYIYYDKNSGISFDVFDNKISSINFFPSQKYYPLMCNQTKAKTLSSTDSLFTEKLEERIYQRYGGPASVEKVKLIQDDIILNCNTEDKPCIANNTMIKVFVSTINPMNDNLIYSYTVSGGNIIGKDAKVQWDLSGVKAGTYTITAAVDDGCGFCGKTITKKVVIKECSDCKNQ